MTSEERLRKALETVVTQGEAEEILRAGISELANGYEREISLAVVRIASPSYLPSELTSVAKELSRVIGQIVQDVHGTGGTIIAADAERMIMAWNAIHPLSGHALAACSSVIRISCNCPPDGPLVSLGVSTGRCFVGNLGIGETAILSVVGPILHETIGLAKEAYVRSAKILVSESTIHHLGAELRCKPFGRIEIPPLGYTMAYTIST